jgi:diguanylate cyclase (GGDEF)-like protein/PAS domain S-box-containing protein
MRATRSRQVFSGSLLVLLTLLTLLGLELSASQSRAHRLVDQRFRARAAVTATLTQSVFASAVRSSDAQATARFGAPHVSNRSLTLRPSEHLAYKVLVGPDGRVIAASPGTPPAVRRAIAAGPPHVRAALAGQTFAISGVVTPLPHLSLLEFAQPIQARSGRRALVAGFGPQAVSGFIGGYLAQAGLLASPAYVLDAGGTVIASADPHDRSGAVLSDIPLLQAIARGDHGALPGRRYFASARVGDSPWRVVLVASSAALYATVNDGRWVQWLLLAGFALAGGLAALLLWRVLRDAGRLAANNERLEHANEELERRVTQLHRSEARMAEAQEIARFGHWEWDVEADVVHWSPELFEIYGLGPDEFIPSFEGYLQMVHSEDRTVVSGLIRTALDRRRSVSFEERIVRRDGQVRVLSSKARVVCDQNGDVARLMGVCQDVTERRQAEQELRDSEERFRLLVDGVPDYAIFMLDAEGRVASWNTGAQRIHGYSEHEIVGAHVSVFCPPEDVAAGKVAAELLTAKRDGRYEEDGWRVRKDGTRFWARLVITALRNADGSLRGYAKVTRDVTERKLAEEKLLHDAMHDTLTGLPNRALFLDRVTQALARARRSSSHHCVVLFLDVDRFKLVNDSYSHVVGDELLIELARRLDSSLRPGDTVARLGGDEFTVLLDDLSDEQRAGDVAARVQALLEQPFEVDGRDIYIDASIGISRSGPDMIAADMMRNADIAMYEAKREGRSRVATFNEDMYSHVVSQLRLETDLRGAIEERRLRVFYQPIIDLRDGRLSGFEALVRWPADGQTVSADEFITVAEDTGLIEPLGRLVLDEACQRLSEWRAAGLIDASATMSVNVSGRQLVDESLLADVGAALGRSGLPAAALLVELTESTIINDPEHMHTALEQLRGIGVKAHIDDFGTGYSSLTFLHHFPGDTLKVDRSFIASMHTDESHAAIVRGIVTLAHSLGFKVIAEGVDDPAQLDRLRELGCELAQGYLFSRPLPADAVAEFVRDWEPDTLAMLAAG